MIFRETKLSGVLIVEPELVRDERGFFARTWSQKEFVERGLVATFVETNISFNRKKGTLRGMHYQAAPDGQTKLVRCTMGAIYDVVVDLRPESATFKSWVAVELSEENYLQLYIPDGCAHGFQSLRDNSEVCYQMSGYYVPNSGRGVRWNDPAFSIDWPEDERIIIERDNQYADFDA